MEKEKKEENKEKREEEKVKKFGTNTLYYYASKYAQSITEADKIEQIDMTEVLISELKYMIENGELVTININGKVRGGKSTIAMRIGTIINNLLIKQGQKKPESKFGIRNIARDQMEKSRMMRDHTLQFDVVVTDEKDDLEDTGENVTVERALDRQFSKVQAARYVHGIQCSPKDIVDENADILLSVIGIDKETRTTHAKLYYRFAEGGDEHIQLLGYIRINVNSIIANWEDKVKKHFYKPKKDKNDIQIIKKWQKKDYYVDYIIRKHQKMELITKNGIFKPRVLDYAEMIQEVVERLRKLASISRLIDANIIRNVVKATARKHKTPLSLIGEQLMTNEVQGLLKTYEQTHKVAKKIKEIKKTPEKHQTAEYQQELKDLKEILAELTKIAKEQEQELERYIDISQEYKRIK